MPQTKIRGNTQILSGTVPRQAMDTTTSGQAAITRLQVQAARLAMSETGVDSGTGVVTIDLATTGVGAGTYAKVTVDVYGRVTVGSSLSAGDIPSGSSYYIQNQSASAQSSSFWISGSGHLGNGLELDSYVPGVVANKLYNNAGTLVWNNYNVITFNGTTSYGRGFLGLADGDAAVSYVNALGIAPIQDLGYMSGWSDGKNIDVSYNSTNRTITLTHASGFIKGFWKGRPVSLVSPWTSAPHSASYASYFLYSTDGVSFNWSTTPFDFRHIHVASVRYLANITAGLREPHGLMDPDVHQELHINIGTYVKSGGTLTVGTYAKGAPESDANNTPGVDSIVIVDEDAETTVPALIQGTYTRIYIDNNNASVFTTGSSFPFSHTPSGFINYYLNGVSTQGVNNSYYCVYGIAVPTTSDAESQAYRWLWLQPQQSYSSLSAAMAESVGALNLGDIQALFQECAPRIKLVYRTSSSYTSTGKVRLEDFAYITKTLNVSATGASASWSTLTGIPTPIQALAGVTPGADLLPYFDSSSTAATTSLTSYGRGLIAVANESSLYTYMNLSNNYVARSGSTMTGELVIAASTAGTSGFNLQTGVDPTATVVGDIWSTGTRLKHYDGTTKQTIAYISDVTDAIHHRTTGIADPVPPVLTNNNNATLTIASSNVTLNQASDFTGNYVTYLVAGATLATTPGTEQYLCVRYNAGSPEYYIENNKAVINASNIICAYVVWTVGTEVHSISCDSRGLGLSNKIASMLTQTQPYKIAVDTSLTPSETSIPTPRTIIVSSAIVYAGTDAQVVVGFNSSQVNHRLTLVYHVAGVWTFRNDTVYDNTYLDNGTDLVTINNSKCSVRWLYRTIGDDTQVFYVLGTGEYNSVDAARQEARPTNLPVVVRNHAMLIGRLIVFQGASSGVIDPVETTTFATSGITDHNALNNLQGGTAPNQYYHLNSAQYTYLTGLASLPNTVGMLYNNGSGTLSWVESLAVASGTKSFTDFGQVSGSNPTIKTTANNIGIGFSDNRGVNWRGGFVTTDTHFGFAQEADNSFTDLKIFVIYQAGANVYQINPTGTLRHRFLGGVVSFGDVTIAGGTFTLGSATGVLVASSGVVSTASAGFNALSLTTANADQVPYYTGTATASTMTVTSFARTLLDDTTSSAFLTTLGISSFAQTVLDDADASTFRLTIGAASTSHAASHYFGGSDAIAGQSLSGLRVTEEPHFGALSVAKTENDGVGAGPYLRVMNDWTTPTLQWLLQLGGSGNLAFWNRTTGGWSLRWNFLTDGTLRQGTVDRITPTGGLRVEDITATYLKVTAPSSGTSYVNIDYNGGVSGNRRMSFRWDDVGDRLEIFTSNDDGTSRSARIRIPRADASSILMYYGLTLASGNLNIAGLTASSLVATDSSKNLVSYTLVANDIPNLDWAKITTGKPTTLGGYGITNATAKSSATASINVTANTWYRVATSTVGVGRNSGEFYIRWSVSGNHGTVRFNASNHYNRNESISIQQLEYGKYIGGITKARIVYYSGVYTSEYCHLEVMFDTNLTGVSVTQEVREVLGWTLTGVGDPGSIPANYTSYDLTFVQLNNIVDGTYAKITFNKEGRVTAGGSLVAGDLPGAAGTMTALSNAQGVLYNSGSGVLSWSPALPIASYSLIGFSNFGVSGTSAYAYGILNNNGIGFNDGRSLAWRGGFTNTDAYFGIMQDASVTSSFKPFIIAGGESTTYYKMDPNDTSFRHYMTGAMRVSTRMTIGSVANKTGAIDVDTGSIRNYVNQNVASLIHFTGINGTRQFIDNAGHRWVGKCILESSIRLPYISTAVSRFSGGSLLNEATQLIEFEGSNYTTFNVSASASFTVEMQVYFNTALTTVFFDFGPSTTGIRATFVPGTGLQVIIQNVTRTFAWSPTSATWYHLAVIRNGTDLFCSVNGVQIGTNYTSTESITVTRNPIIAAGSSAVGDYFGCLEGRINEFRYIKSAISTTPTFTAPTSIYDYGSFSQPGNVSSVVNGPGLVMTSDGAGNGTFQPPRRTTILTFALAEDVINTSIYFHSWIGAQGGPRSGATTGMNTAGACSPIVVPFTGRITSATVYAGRLAVNAASVTYPCFLQTVLNTVTSGAEHNSQRTSSNINFSVRFAHVGTINTVDCVANVNNINQPVTAGDCLALKFVNGSATNLIGMAGNVFVSLTLEEVM